MDIHNIIDFYALRDMNDVLIIFVASTFTFLLFAWDKFLALHEKNRVPEYLLMTFVVIAGAFGALCGMIFFKYKTQKPMFAIGVPVCMCIHLILIILYRVFIH